MINSEDSMRGLFFIVKGQYRKGVEPSFVNKVSGEVNFIGGYDPHNEDTKEWYMVMDKVCFNCVAFGSDLNKVLKSVYTNIVRWGGSAKSYFKHLSEISSNDYYETHYLGKRPLTPQERSKKAEGRCPRVSPVMHELYTNVYDEYGDVYEDLVEEQEDLAYEELAGRKPLKKTKKLYRKLTPATPKEEVVETPKKKKKEETPVKKNVVLNKKPLIKHGIKKLKLS